MHDPMRRCTRDYIYLRIQYILLGRGVACRLGRFWYPIFTV